MNAQLFRHRPGTTWATTGGAHGQSATLEDRIRAIEDRLEIYNLIASHPPSADTGADYYTRAAYVEDGVIDLGGGKAATGNETIAAVAKTPGAPGRDRRRACAFRGPAAHRARRRHARW